MAASQQMSHKCLCLRHSLVPSSTSYLRLPSCTFGTKLRRYHRCGCKPSAALMSGPEELAASVWCHTAPLLAADADSLSRGLYGLGQQMDVLVQQQLTGVSPLTFAAVLVAGLATSLSPCTLSVLPLTIGYIGGYSDAGTTAEGGALLGRAAGFAFGLATSLAILGVASSLLGRTYGNIGRGLPIAVSGVAIVMGLNLLDVLRLRLPSLDVDVRQLAAPPLLQAYLAGLTFALAASPCSTPVLATLLAFVAQTRDPLLGGSLLLTYTCGYVAPLLVAATFAGALKQVLALRQYSTWITPASGTLLLAGGTYGLLTRVFPG